MTAITPLESIHKKGIFGDHHKKEEKDLLRIAEIKDLAIIQVVQYKKSNIKLESVKIKNLTFPLENLQVSSDSETRILWNAPRTWLIISRDRNIIETIKKNCDEKNFAVTDISHSRAIIQIKGSQAREVLKKGSPINFNEFKVNECAGTVYHGITIIVDSISDNPDTYNLLTLRSFGESFYYHITDSALEFGYVGV